MELHHLGAVRFNTQPPEGGWRQGGKGGGGVTQVSTHSRPKAAGVGRRTERSGRSRFNTQPPEGGWDFSWL